MTHRLLKTPIRLAGWLFAAALIAPAQQVNVGRPGMINYTEGQVSLDGTEVAYNAVGRAAVAPGEVLQTADGRAEMLLTPGVFLRMDHNTAVKMVDPSLIDTQVELQQGTALVEVDQVARENHLNVVTGGVTTQLTKKGIYQFQANPGLLFVYDGEAVVAQNDRSIEVKKGHTLALGTPEVKTQKFDRDQASALYDWSKLRAEYVAEANAASAQMIVVDNPAWYMGTGWYWNPWYDSWAFVPGMGYIASPFGLGFGFYSPVYWTSYVAPYYGFRGPVYRGRVPLGYHAAAPGPRFAGPRMSAAPAMRGGFGGHIGGFGGHIGGRGR